MVKVDYSSEKGLVQSSGAFSFQWDCGQIEMERVHATEEVDTANGTTTTDTTITIPALSRVIAYKVEVVSAANAPNGSITDLGFKTGTVDAIMDGVTINANTAGAKSVGYAAAGSGTVLADGNVLMLTHANPGGAGKTSKVRVSVIYDVAR
tara:strand:+ start:37 stop:489 length:453 start_codon:yes stop_codon:yes gene_type:complete